MPKFWVIAGMGHCGTKWLASVLNSQPGIVGTHELKQKMSNMNWHVAASYEHRHGVGGDKYQPYFEAIRNSQAGIVVDANSWSPALLPEVNRVVKIDRVILILRHGVSQLHSLDISSDVWHKTSASSYLYNDYLQPYFDLTDYKGRAMTGIPKWKRLCLFWQGMTVIPEKLAAAGLPVEVYKFEGLTQREELRTMIPTIDDKELVNWRARDVNRKVEGDRRPNSLWTLWSNSQRKTFKDVCAAGMEHFGYEMPGA